MIWLADISNHQGDISIEQIVAEGYSAVICKASEGTSFRDGWFDGWIPRIKAAGAIPGAYHFLRAGDGAAQARILHARVADHGGPSGFLCALDNEADASWETTVAFAETWREISGGHPLLMYTGGWWWRPRGWPGAELTPYLWHSHYVTGSGYGSALYGQVGEDFWTPGYGGWPQATILQFSSSARVAGQVVDVNAFRGSLTELLALAGITSTTGGQDMALTAQQEQVVVEGTSLVARMAKGFDTLDDGTTPNELYRMIRDLAQRPAAALSEDQLAGIGAAAATQAAEIVGGRLEEVEAVVDELKRLIDLLVASRVAAAGAESDALAP